MDFLILPSDLVAVNWLEKNIHHKELILLDASWFMPMLKRDGQSEWAKETIPGALFFDFDKCICDQCSELPHMMPSADLFQRASRALGINQGSALVVFDRLGIFSSPRVWWMFKSMGFDNIAVLDGGLKSWKEAGLATCAGVENHNDNKGDFIAHEQVNLICDEPQVLTATVNKEIQILDARPEARFLGQVAEPRADLRSGHMPSAKSLPFTHLLDNGKMRKLEQLQVIYAKLIGDDEQAIFSCGSGVTACVLALGATLCGYQHLSVYDGSWAQWGADEKLPVVK